MGLSIANLAVQTYILQLNNIEAETLSLMTTRATNSSRTTQLKNALLDNKSSRGLEPSKSDYYYTTSVGTDDQGNTYTIDSRYQDYSSITTDKGAYVNLTATKTSVGATLTKDKPVKVLRGKAFTGTTVNFNDVSFETPDCNKPATGVVAKVKVIDPACYYVQDGTEEIKEGEGIDAVTKTVPHYRQATDSDDVSKLMTGTICGCNAQLVSAGFTSSDTFYISKLGACRAVDRSCDGKYNYSSAGIKTNGGAAQYIYFPESSGLKPCGGESVRMIETGEDKINNAFNCEQSLNNLYYITQDKQCKKVESMEMYQDLKTQGKTFVIKTGDVPTNGLGSGIYYDEDASDSSPKTVGGHSTYDMTTAMQDGTVPANVCEELINAAIHCFGANYGYDSEGNTECTPEFIKNNYDIVDLGDGKWGLVNKNIQVGGDASIYQIDNSGEYQEPVGQVSAHNLQFDGDGNLVGFQNDNNSFVQLKSSRVFDEEGYEKALKEYNYELKQSEVEESEIQKQIANLAQEDSELEIRLNELGTLKKVIDQFLETAKELAKSDAERLGKAFSA